VAEGGAATRYTLRMAVGLEQRNRQQLAEQQARTAQQDEEKQELERLEEGQEVSAQQAELLQPQIGNAALANLLARAGGQSAGAASSHEEEVAEEIVESQDEEELQELEGEGPQYGGGGGGAGGAGGPNDPWDLGRLFGGDDEGGGAEGGGAAQPRLRASPIRELSDPFDEDPLPDEEEDSPYEPHHQQIDALLPAVAPLPSSPRRGDARFLTPELDLLDARAIAGLPLSPEELAHGDAALAPLARPLELARFLAAHGLSPTTRALARGIAGGASFFLLPSTGSSGAAARLATMVLAALAQEAESASQGDAPDELALATDRAARLALVREAWPLAVQTARELASTRRLRAPFIADAALAGRLDTSEQRPEPTMPPDSLGGRALASLLPVSPLLFIPPLASSPPPPLPEDDETAAIDALLAEWTGGADPRELPPDPVLEAEALEPALAAASDLVNAMGRAQVELAAGAIAAREVNPRAAVRQVLIHGDRALRLLARDAVQAGDALAELRGAPLLAAEALAAPRLRVLRQSVQGLEVLRTWAFGELATAAVGVRSVAAEPDSPPLAPLLGAALRQREGGDRVRGRQGLRAVALSTPPPDGPLPGLLAAFAALEAGDGPDAALLIDGALRLDRAGPLELAAASMRACLALGADLRVEAAAAVDRLEALARRRHTPLALADAAILRSELRLRQEGLEASVDGLVGQILEHGRAGEQAAMELLKARLTEQRAAHDEAAFDPAMERAIAAREGEAQATTAVQTAQRRSSPR